MGLSVAGMDRLSRPFRALTLPVASNRRASPWAVLGCPVGAQGGDLRGSSGGGFFVLLSFRQSTSPLRL
jgi:hypothetical protein